ncbi:MAG: hypothetical protein BWX95_01632 [Bacteroidetes bacterium ADurb.Bin141]|nr:MAG: hypothetical protein UZ10_BCD003002009 [Bacteroidetes bacterium OLB10]MCC7515347.1 hypothetical protein [Bacteroidia bacterium]MCE7954684.1 hypothetical protein [Bacteroidetes bacterium CHB6]OQB61835.1 MAG: hypothetical protein BWX95_01632 [Bacteroidetes bacterium ADurb.Bin141]
MLISCVQSSGNKKSVLFKSYLKSEFDFTLNTDRKYFLIITESACTGCDKSALNAFSKSNISNLYLLISKKNYNQWNEKMNNKNILIDKTGNLNKINIGAENTALIVWEGNSISDVVSLTPDNVDSVFLSISM